MPDIEVTTLSATDITETTATLRGEVFIRVGISSVSNSWDGPRLEVEVTYTADIMADISGVEESQFELETTNSNVTPDSIEKIGSNLLRLNFEFYDEDSVDTEKDLIYTESATENERLKCYYSDRKVKSPETITIEIENPTVGERFTEDTITASAAELLVDAIQVFHESGHDISTIQATSSYLLVDFIHSSEV